MTTIQAISLMLGTFIGIMGTCSLWRLKEAWGKPLAIEFYFLAMWVAVLSGQMSWRLG